MAISVAEMTGVQEVFASCQRAFAPEPVRWMAPSALHLTLHFIGNVDDVLVAEIEASMKQVAKACSPFNMSVEGMGVFPSMHHPHVVWVGASLSEPLVMLQHRVTDGIRLCGLKVDNALFVPHITLGRIGRRGVQNWPDKWWDGHQMQQVGVLLVKSFSLYESVLSASGSIYRRLVDFELKA